MPAEARMIASYSPSLSLRIRVSTLPRRSLMVRSGRSDKICIRRRSDDVPTTAPSGSASILGYFSLSSASRTSSRSVIAASFSPSGISVGTSLSECTASCASPRSIVSSISLRKSPLPPIFANGTSRILSPLVTTILSSTSSPGFCSCKTALMCSDCHSANLLPRVAITSFFI